MIIGVVLAAGASRRFGAQKLLVPIAGVPLVRRTCESLLATPLARLVVVLGRDAAAVSAVLEGLDLETVTNPRYGDGMSTSLRAGLLAIPDTARAVLVALGDQPGVGPAIVEPLIERYQASGGPIVAPLYRRGVRGNPVLFDRSLFPELQRVSGDEGARSVIASDPSRVTLVPLDVDEPPDVDRPGDLAEHFIV